MDKLEWPSERVAHGGIFHQRNVNYSKETHEMIKSEFKLFSFLISSTISRPLQDSWTSHVWQWCSATRSITSCVRAPPCRSPRCQRASCRRKSTNCAEPVRLWIVRGSCGSGHWTPSRSRASLKSRGEMTRRWLMLGKLVVRSITGGEKFSQIMTGFGFHGNERLALLNFRGYSALTGHLMADWGMQVRR